MTTTNSTSEVSYGRRLTEIAAERPDDVDITIVHRDGSERDLSWRELETRANQIARALQAHGVGKDDVVGLALPSSAEHVLVTLAIWKLGATLLPLRHDLPDWEMDRMLAMARPKVLVSDTHHAEAPVLTRADLDATASLDASALPDAISECVNLVASSGSTGFPKLIVTPSRGVVADEPSTGTTKGNEPSVCLVTSPLYHVNGFAFAAPNALEGDRVYIMERFDAAQAVELIEKHQITFTVMVPTMLQRVARLPDLDPKQLASLGRIVYGGARVPDWVVDRWLELVDPAKFVLTYGSSERLGLMMMTGEEWAEHRGATGRPVDSTLSIRDEAGKELPRGEVGDIYVKPDPERRIFEYIGIPTPDPTPDGFFTLGDIGWMDADGYLYVTDRRKDMIVSGGANVFPAEVEAALSEHPEVVDQVVVGVPDDEWGQRVHAIVQVADPANPPSADELRAWCKERLASYKVPKTVEIVERVPRTEAGKLNRTDLGNERRDIVTLPAVSALPTEPELDALWDACSARNWGRWGGDDELGTLNHLTDDHRRRAASLVVDGVTISLAHDLGVDPTPECPFPAHHHMLAAGDSRENTGIPGYEASRDYVGTQVHGLGITHVDALCHMFVRGEMYNGRPASDVRSDGARSNTIMAFASGVVGRGVLLDMVAANGGEPLADAAVVTHAELEAAEGRLGVEVGTGDILCIATGRDARRAAAGGVLSPGQGMAGVHPDSLPFFAEREIAVLGSDGISDPMPGLGITNWIFPVHQIGIAGLGLPLIDNLHLGRLAEHCAAVGRYEFLFTLGTLRIVGGTGCPANPIAVL